MTFRLATLAVVLAAAASASAADLELLFLGDRGHHRPAERFAQLLPVMAERGIRLVYTEQVGDLNRENLAKYAALVIYANIDELSPAEEAALLEYVADGGGLVALHCASFCFRNSPKYVDLVGAQFKRHGMGAVRTRITAPDHPLVKGFGGFSSWDETYVHDKHNEVGRIVLETRDEADKPEPWTWIRTQGKGRVFYTAWGHDERTWSHAGFHNLVERGIRWAAGSDPAEAGAYEERPFASYAPRMTEPRKDVKPFEYVEAKVPFYPEGGARKGDGEWNKMQLPLSPEESLKHYVHPDDFELRLFAAEPQIGKALAMTWDARGRLWLCESTDYPNNLGAAGKGNDRIRICEDTDADGRADKFTVFAEKLSIPTTLAFHRRGVIVQNATETLYLRDTDGDDRADERRVLLTGWGAGDTHGGVSNFRYGPDHWYWGMQGYNASTPARPAYGEHAARTFGTFRMGFFRFKLTNDDDPVIEELEFVRSTNNNTWGLGFNDQGDVFGSTANGNPSVFMPIANRYYEAVRGWAAPQLGGIAESNELRPVTEKVRQVDHHHGFTAACGHAIYTGYTFPQAYRNRTAFVCEPTAHLVATFVIEPDGGNYKSHNAWNLVASDDEWAAPIMAEVGPDGNVWVLDWYNYIVQHNPTPVGYQTGKGNAYETELRDKRHGRVFRVVPKDDFEISAGRNLEALSRDELLKELIVGDFGGSNRQHILRLLHDQGLHDVQFNSGDTSSPVRADLEGRRLRQSLLEAAESTPDPVQARLVLDRLHDAALAGDRILIDAAICAAARHDRMFLEAALASNKTSPAAGEAVARVAEHWARATDPPPINDLLAAIGRSQSPYVGAAIEGLALGWPKNRPAELSAAAEEAIGNLIRILPNDRKGRLVTLAERLGSRTVAAYAVEITAALTSEATTGADETRRAAAAKQLVEFRRNDPKVVAALLQSISPRTSPELARGILAALAESEVPELGKQAAQRLPTLAPAARGEAIRLLLSRSEWTPALLASLDGGAVQLGELSLEQKQTLSAHPDQGIARRARNILARGGGLPNPDRQKVLDELRPLTETKGDAALGKAVFTKNCAKCHMHSGEGNKIGPDLTGMAVHPKRELLVHLIDPNRSVEGNFRVYTVETDDGRVLSGLLASESKTTVELIDAEAKRHVLQRDEIETLTASTKSLMPEGFEKQVSRDDLANLLEFLTTRGKFLPLDLRKAATIVTTRGMFYKPESTVERLTFSDWTPKSFAGVPFALVDPQGDRNPNGVLLYGPQGSLPPRMPRSVKLAANAAAKAVHLLSGVSGWGFPLGEKGSTSMIVRLHYADGATEDHALKNGEHFADYIRRVDVPGSQFAFDLGGRQLRYLSITPGRAETIREIELMKGPDRTAPLVMAVTVETR
jgi:putative membrane-bound dehydrogenase-like protein